MSTRTMSPPTSPSRGAKSSPRRTTARQPARSRCSATPRKRGCCHLCRFIWGSPAMHTRRHHCTPQGELRFDFELRGSRGPRVQLTTCEKPHCSLINTANRVVSPSEVGEEVDTHEAAAGLEVGLDHSDGELRAGVTAGEELDWNSPGCE